MSKYDDLVTKLKEVFQIDQPELDFGVYRILNARAGEFNDYLENRLCAKLAINPANSEFELVYINGDHNIPTAFTSLETEGGSTKQIKIRQIEAEFLSRMFN